MVLLDGLGCMHVYVDMCMLHLVLLDGLGCM